MRGDPTRRRYLRYGGAVAAGAVGLAGCQTADDSGTATGSPEPETTVSGGESPLIVAHDMVLGQGGVLEEGEVFCTLEDRFKRGQQIVWRIRVVDGRTGDFLTDEQLDGVFVNFQSLQPDTTLPGGYGPHPPNEPTDEYWVVPWVVPDDFPAGELEYRIGVDQPDGREIRRVMFDVPATQPLVILDAMAEPRGTATATQG